MCAITGTEVHTLEESSIVLSSSCPSVPCESFIPVIPLCWVRNSSELKVHEAVAVSLEPVDHF